MLLSIDNFKSIEHVVQVDISDLTVLAGANSSGKSSLIQALLLLKQTLNSSSSQMLNLNGPYVYANTLMDLMHNKKGGDMKFGLILSGNELKDKLPVNCHASIFQREQGFKTVVFDLDEE